MNTGKPCYRKKSKVSTHDMRSSGEISGWSTNPMLVACYITHSWGSAAKYVEMDGKRTANRAYLKFVVEAIVPAGEY